MNALYDNAEGPEGLYPRMSFATTNSVNLSGRHKTLVERHDGGRND